MGAVRNIARSVTAALMLAGCVTTDRISAAPAPVVDLSTLPRVTKTRSPAAIAVLQSAGFASMLDGVFDKHRDRYQQELTTKLGASALSRRCMDQIVIPVMSLLRENLDMEFAHLLTTTLNERELKALAEYLNTPGGIDMIGAAIERRPPSAEALAGLQKLAPELRPGSLNTLSARLDTERHKIIDGALGTIVVFLKEKVPLQMLRDCDTRGLIV